MPDDWWRQIGAIGTPDAAAAHVQALAEAGADLVALFLAPDRSLWEAQLGFTGDLVTTLVG
jgi:alkanesulfonate monooxygenase SsuD/methylene tetrahydromethanopterin reductase-like flavin-dependent oxidoreductase (luciferase family)